MANLNIMKNTKLSNLDYNYNVYWGKSKLISKATLREVINRVNVSIQLQSPCLFILPAAPLDIQHLVNHCYQACKSCFYDRMGTILTQTSLIATLTDLLKCRNAKSSTD